MPSAVLSEGTFTPPPLIDSEEGVASLADRLKIVENDEDEAMGEDVDDDDLDEEDLLAERALMIDEGELKEEDESPLSSPPHDNDASSTSSGIATDLSRSPRSDGSPRSGSEGHSPSSAASLRVLSASTATSPRSHHPPEKKHVCDICSKAFPYLSILESHKRCHTGEKPFNCHYCDKRFAQKATLQVHERTHTGERPYKCRYCEKTFAQYGTKTVHEKSAHLGIRNYKCPKCDKCLSSPSALYTHKKTHGEKVFACAFCPKTFTLKNYLKLHVKQVHEQTERKHICSYCNKSFAYAGSLQVHIRTHTGERPYVCRYCPKAFASQGNLQSHERTHTGERPYSCDTCGRSFIQALPSSPLLSSPLQKSQLTAHEATHANGETAADRKASMASASGAHSIANPYAGIIAPIAINGASLPAPTPLVTGERPGEHSCKVCGKRYAYASSLYVHARVHTGERPFRCNYCEKTFTNQGNMQVHLRVHTGEKPYKCTGCSKCYAQKVGLKIHHEQCSAFLSSAASCSTSSGARGSTSPLNETTDDDDSGRGSRGEENVMLVEGRKLSLEGGPLSHLMTSSVSGLMPVHNIYASVDPSQCFAPSTPTASLPFTLSQNLQHSLSGWPKLPSPLFPSSDFGPLTASKPPPMGINSPPMGLASLSDSLTSAFAPVQSSTDSFLKGILDNAESSSLLVNLLLQLNTPPTPSLSLPPSPPSVPSTLELLALLQQSSQSSTQLVPPTSLLPPNLSPTNATSFAPPSSFSTLLHPLPSTPTM